MLNMIKKMPMPICGVILGLASLGNLLQSYSEAVRYICGAAAALLLILFTLRCILCPAKLREDLGNPITTSVAATFPMAVMVLSVHANPWLGTASMVIWLLAVLLHILLILYFTVKFIVKPDLSKVFASYYIVYVGIVVASMTAPAYGLPAVGIVAFWFGFVCLPVLLALVTVRYAKRRPVPEPARPLICIYAAPMSLCVAGYVQSVTPKNFAFLATMYIAASILYMFSLIKAVGYLKLPFYPSYAAFTFPFVISAIASKQTMACAANLGSPLPFLQPVVWIETLIAVLIVLYVLAQYIVFLCKKTAVPQG